MNDLQIKVSELIEKLFGRDAWNPCHGYYAVTDIEKIGMECMRNREGKINELEQKLAEANDLIGRMNEAQCGCLGDME